MTSTQSQVVHVEKKARRKVTAFHDLEPVTGLAEVTSKVVKRVVHTCLPPITAVMVSSLSRSVLPLLLPPQQTHLPFTYHIPILLYQDISHNKVTQRQSHSLLHPTMAILETTLFITATIPAILLASTIER